MERLRLIKAVTVRGTVQICVQILFCLPGLPIEQLAIASVATCQRVSAPGYLELSRVFKENVGLSVSEIGAVVYAGAQVGGPRGGGEVVLGLMVGSRVEHSARTIATAPHLHGDVLLRDELGIESNRSETVTM